MQEPNEIQKNPDAILAYAIPTLVGILFVVIANKKFGQKGFWKGFLWYLIGALAGNAIYALAVKATKKPTSI